MILIKANNESRQAKTFSIVCKYCGSYHTVLRVDKAVNGGDVGDIHIECNQCNHEEWCEGNNI